MSKHRAALVKLVQKQGWTKGAELGVDKGVLFSMLLDGCPSLSLIGVDTCPDPHRLQKCLALASEHSDRAQMLVMTTNEASAIVPDRSLDFAFIDADHSEPAVAIDIRDWQPKVKRGGWLGGHDYNRKFPGVVRAVDRAFGKNVKTWPGSIWGVWQ